MSKFTPGPWEVGPYDPRLIFGYDGGLIAEACRGDAKEDITNARLIAAAPLMYEALQDMVNDYKASFLADPEQFIEQALNKAQAALDAAKLSG